MSTESGVAATQAPAISRRRVLALGVGCGALLLAGGVVTRRALGAPATLTAGDRAVVDAIAVTIYPGNPGPPGDRVGAADFVDAYLRDGLEPGGAKLLIALFRAVEYGAAIGLGGRFTHLPPAKRQAFLAAFEGHRSLLVRSAMTALKVVITLAYFDHPAVEEAAGIRRSCPVMR